MPTPRQLAASTRNAHEFLQRLHLEVSYLIREVEGQLGQEDDEFVQLTAGGYAMITSTSSGLDPDNVKLWMPRTFTAAFGPRAKTEMEGIYTTTQLPANAQKRLLILHVVLADTNESTPRVWFGKLTKAQAKKANIIKFEQLTSKFARYSERIFSNVSRAGKARWEDSQCALEGKFLHVDLFDIKSSKDVRKRIVDPLLAL